jgi:hypothetical protein
MYTDRFFFLPFPRIMRKAFKQIQNLERGRLARSEKCFSRWLIIAPALQQRID